MPVLFACLVCMFVEQYGRVKDVDIKRARNSAAESCYAFVEFESIR